MLRHKEVLIIFVRVTGFKLQMVTPGKASLSFLTTVTFVCVGYCRKSWIVIYICVAATIKALINIKSQRIRVFQELTAAAWPSPWAEVCAQKSFTSFLRERNLFFPPAMMKNFNAIVDFQFALINFIYTYLYEDYFTSMLNISWCLVFVSLETITSGRVHSGIAQLWPRVNKTVELSFLFLFFF